MVEEVSLVEIINILKKRMNWIINLSLVGLLLASIYTFFLATPMYESTAQLLVNRTQNTEVIQRSELESNVQLINTYKDIIRGPVILDDVIDSLNLPVTNNELREQLSITTESNSQVFNISVIDENPNNAAVIANTTANVFQEKLDSIMNIDNVTIIANGEPEFESVSPNNILNLIIGLTLGSVIGISLVLMLDFFDNTVKEEKFLTEHIGWTSLGIISEMSSQELNAETTKTLSRRSTNLSNPKTRV